MAARLAFLCALALSCVGSCTTDSANCEDADCPPGLTCEAGRCACRDDAACGPSAFCNTAGSCQTLPACRSNADCDVDQRCDLSTGLCRVTTECGIDTHCAFGEVCVDSNCVSGCREDGDCGPLALCRRTDNNTSALGGCVAGVCDVNQDCPFGERCVGGQCFVSPNQSHCADCTDRDCPFEEDFCLVNPRFEAGRPTLGTAFFCGVECTGDPDICPSGYACDTVILLTSFRCLRGESCGSGRTCVLEEGANEGFCTCATTADCPNDTRSARCILGFCEWPRGQLCSAARDCQPLPLCGRYGPGAADVCFLGGEACTEGRECQCFEGACLNSNRPCTTASDCMQTCENGGCRVGEACKPRDGLTCPDVTR